MSPPMDASLLGPSIVQIDGSTTANTALLKATLAFDRIERHEMECSKRWGVAIKLLLLMLTQLGGLLFFLISDKLGWLV